MGKTNVNEMEAHTAGPIAIGFDYQFYLFMFYALKLEHGQKIGFEAKDDIHIDLENGITILFQAKHTVQQNVSGQIKNLTELDSDLWKTLSNWTDFIKAPTTGQDFLDKHLFILVTNKGNTKNDFIDSLAALKKSENVDDTLNYIKELLKQTQDKTIKKRLRNIVSLGKKKLKAFLLKVSIETSTDGIITKIKEQLFMTTRDVERANVIFDKLYSNLQEAKYLEIKSGNKFEITFDDFNRNFGRCFRIASELKPLPRRNFPIHLPDAEDLESQIFIKQLLDIGDLMSGSDLIIEYTTKMLTFSRHFTYWSDDENFIQLTEAGDFKRNSIEMWNAKFRSKYRLIERQLHQGKTVSELDEEIKTIGVEIIDFLREKDVAIQGYPSLGLELSNGHFYALSDNLEVGWRFDWKEKYMGQ